VDQVTVSSAAGRVVCERCDVARTPVARMRGLLGRAGLPPGEGILLRPAGSIHTAFMRFPIDAVFVDGENTVLKIAHELPPWRLAAARGARAVIELPAGEAARRGVAVGTHLRLAAFDAAGQRPDRSVQTDGRARPARPDAGIASDALAAPPATEGGHP
jgi:uncharacterized membrane protein (UPF0127 family)